MHVLVEPQPEVVVEPEQELDLTPELTIYNGEVVEIVKSIQPVDIEQVRSVVRERQLAYEVALNNHLNGSTEPSILLETLTKVRESKVALDGSKSRLRLVDEMVAELTDGSKGAGVDSQGTDQDQESEPDVPEGGSEPY